eukprot:CAMPEP_0170197804 /NCGR_PEP_ID=MMETSP0040_2-20121228/67240_1 /TAXON_ID=641309 /ORGANISM="Lotharella oceanica, Strain CCMP622" /LENGTH=205 /DNA_ID=CAMNT_0010447567 /DNA_START=1 /DNA_END=615 /DNA_ORIENTATION=-
MASGSKGSSLARHKRSTFGILGFEEKQGWKGFAFRATTLDAVRKWASEEDIEEARKFAHTFRPQHLPTDKMEVSFARSSGAGGQNVNKVNTKAEVRFSMSAAKSWLPRYTVKQLSALERNRINKRGEFVVQSQRHRTQEKNLHDCYAKIFDMIRDASYVPSEASEEKQERIKELAEKATESRIKRKKEHSSKKKDRKARKSGDFF